MTAGRRWQPSLGGFEHVSLLCAAVVIGILLSTEWRMTQCLLFICSCETMHRMNSIKNYVFLVWNCVHVQRTDHRSSSSYRSLRPRYVLCALIFKTSPSASAHLRPSCFARILTFLLTNAWQSYFTLTVYVHHNLCRFTAYVKLCSVNRVCVAVCFMLLCCCCCCCCSSVILYGLFVSVVASWLTTSNKNPVELRVFVQSSLVRFSLRGKNHVPSTTHRKLHTAYRTPHTAHRTLHTAHCTPHTAHLTPHTHSCCCKPTEQLKFKIKYEINRRYDSWLQYRRTAAGGRQASAAFLDWLVLWGWRNYWGRLSCALRHVSVPSVRSVECLFV